MGDRMIKAVYRDMKSTLNNKEKPLKEKIKWLRYFIDEEFRRTIRLNQFGYYTKKGYENIYILQTVYFKMLSHLDHHKTLTNINFEENIDALWDELVLETTIENKYSLLNGRDYLYTSFGFVKKQIERNLMLETLPFEEDTELFLKNVEAQHLLNFPEGVKKVTIEDETIDTLSEHMLKINRVDKTYELETTKTERHKNRDHFKLIVEIFDAEDIKRIPNLDKIDGVSLNIENIYLRNNFKVNIHQRLAEYEKITKLLPNKELIIFFPRQNKLQQFLEIEDAEITTPFDLSIHYYMYDMEIYCINKIGKEHKIKAVIPKALNEEDYIYYRFIIEKGLKVYPKKKYLEIGFSVDNEVVYEYIDHYKPFEFLCIDMDELYEELYEPEKHLSYETFKKRFMNDIREIHQFSRVRRKPDYIRGSYLNNESIFKKCINLGFRNYIIDMDKIDKYDKILEEHLNTRGKHKKKKNI